MLTCRERKILLDLYATTPNKKLAEILDISISMVAYKGRCLGLRKDKQYLSETNRQNGMNGHKFSKQKI